MTATFDPDTSNSEPSNPLTASYRLPVATIAISLAVLFIQPWVSLAIALFGLFLLYQTTVLRLVFDTQAMVLYRNETVLRQFPYQDWQSWRILLPPIPIWFYFREVNSIHSFPILFSARELRQQLEARLPNLERANL